jgi:hypothetical protein
VAAEDLVFVAVRWNMSTDLGDNKSPTYLVVFHPSDGKFVSRSRKPLLYIPWALAYDRVTRRLLGVWVNDALKRHEVIHLDPLTGNHSVLKALPINPYCTTQSGGDCNKATPPWGKAMLDLELRRWTLPMSSQLGWNLTLVHVDIDQLSLQEVPVTRVGYQADFSTVTNSALDRSSKHLFIVALCAKCTSRIGSQCMATQSKLIRIEPNTGAITEVPGITGIGWNVGGANSVYDSANSVLYYVRYTEASFSRREIVALSTNGSGLLASEDIGSHLPPDFLLLVPESKAVEGDYVNNLQV